MQMFHFVVMVTLIATTTAVYDSELCKKQLDSVHHVVGEGIKPLFYDDLYVFMEIKNLMNTTVVYLHEAYSQETEMAYFKISNATSETKVWVDAKTDEIMTGPTTTAKCQDSKIDGSTFAKMFGVTLNGTDVVLNNPDVALGWHKKFNQESAYLGQSSARGLMTEQMMVCSFNPYTGITAVTTWHLVNPNTTVLPVLLSGISNIPVLPVMAHVIGVNNTDLMNPQPFQMSIDFAFYDGIDPSGPVFQIPSDMLCAAKKSQQIPLPQGSTYFQFRGEEIDIGNPNGQIPDTPNIIFTIQKYMHGEKIFVVDYISTPSFGSTNDKSFQRIIDDFNTGLSFNMDLVAGYCSGNAIQQDSIDTVSTTGGFVQMRNFQQFFDIDSDQYQYMGIHTIRGIDCDTWSATFNDSNPNHKKDSLYTWYFANPQWMKKFKYSNWTNPLPVTLEIMENTRYSQFNFYDYDTRDNIAIPDVSLCMNTDFTYNLQLSFFAPYSDLTALTIDNVNRALYAMLKTKTSLNTVLRISNFDIQSAGKETLVKFKLFDLRYLHVTGDIPNFQYGATNKQIFDELTSLVNTNTFSIDVLDPATNGDFQTFYARSNSLTMFNSTVHTVTKSQSSTSSGYSPGSMAGIGIGMLILGLVLGVLVIFAVGKVRQMKGSNEVDMKKLDQESET